MRRAGPTQRPYAKSCVRVAYVIVTTAVSGIFHPKNRDGWTVKKEKLDRFLADPLVADALWNADLSDVSDMRKIVISFLRKRWYPLVQVVAMARYRQKEGLPLSIRQQKKALA